jgi:hypothetical protein
MKSIYVIAGGTMNHVTPHFSLCAPAYGAVGRELNEQLHVLCGSDYNVFYIPTKMAGNIIDWPDTERELEHLGVKQPETNEDLNLLVDALIANPDTRCIVMAAAVCDFKPDRLSEQTGLIQGKRGLRLSDFGKDQERLSSRAHYDLKIVPDTKIISKIRRRRKDIFLVAFKATTNKESNEQYRIGLEMLKKNSCNIVLANDLATRNNMIIVPEEARYCETKSRSTVIDELAEIIEARLELTFTRSTVIDGDPVDWNSDIVPSNLKAVVDHCINRGAYKPFRGATVGHFAFKVDDKTVITSKRGSNFNDLADTGMVKIEAINADEVIAYGAKPSVGGQSQRIIFKEHEGYECIVHFHCPLRPGADISTVEQFPYECGSHECGQNTSGGLREEGEGIKAVMLDNHGPNIVFRRDADPDDVINFIEKNFVLVKKTGGPVSEKDEFQSSDELSKWSTRDEILEKTVFSST